MLTLLASLVYFGGFILKIILQNIQAFEKAEYEFMSGEVVAIHGGNSNGKSILFKVLNDIVTGELSSPAYRKADVRKGCEKGEVIIQGRTRTLHAEIFTGTGTQLTLYVKQNNGEYAHVTRSITDKLGWNKLIHQFGFRVYDNICLQLYQTYSPIPLINTSQKINEAIIKDVTTDTIAETFIESVQKLFMPQMRTALAELENSEKAMTLLIDKMKPVQNWREYQTAAEELNFMLQQIGTADSYLTPVPDIPDIQIYDIKPHLTEMPLIPDNIKFASDISYDVELDNYKTVLDGKCPTCGKYLLGGIHNECTEQN